MAHAAGFRNSALARLCRKFMQKLRSDAGVRCMSQVHGSFRYDGLQIKQATDRERAKKPDFSNLAFGANFSDHMFEVEWTEDAGWGTPRITPLHMFQMHPAAKVYHYAQGVFEGMKAFKDTKDKVYLFRPEENMKRMMKSSERACLPPFDGKELLKCIQKLVSIDKDWVPARDMSSLYIRPTFIGIQESLGVQAANKALLYVITGPVGPYFKQGVGDPVSLLADPNFVRACPGGSGEFKMASNYAPTLYVQQLAQKQGLHQVLWLFGDDHQVTEVGAMNVFFVLKKSSDGGIELVTPPLNGVILPGVVRKSILELARQWKSFDVSERVITMKELVAARDEKRLLEMFGAGTACIVCPVKSIKYMDQSVDIPTMDQQDPLYLRFQKAVTDIQYRRVEHPWSVPIE